MTAVGGNVRLIEGIFQRRAVLRRSRLDVSLTMLLIGAAAGFLSMSTYSQSARTPTKPVEAKPMGSGQQSSQADRASR